MICLLQFELIETLWNVNINGSNLSHDERVELIETLWNVNFADSK